MINILVLSWFCLLTIKSWEKEKENIWLGINLRSNCPHCRQSTSSSRRGERGAIMEGNRTHIITKDLKYPRFECHRIISDGIYSGNKKSNTNKKKRENLCELERKTSINNAGRTRRRFHRVYLFVENHNKKVSECPRIGPF